MALHSKKDFAAICNITTKEISVYLKRRKIIASGDYIDDAIRENQEFIAKRQLMKAAQEDTEEVEVKPPVPNVKAPRYKPDKKLKIDDPELPLDETGTNLYSLTKKKLLTEIAKKEKETKILESRIEKLRGELMPTDLVKLIFKQHSKSIMTEFKNAVDDIITKISKKKDLTLQEVADVRRELIEAINTAVNRSVDSSNKSIENVIAEYAETREVGERS